MKRRNSNIKKRSNTKIALLVLIIAATAVGSVFGYKAMSGSSAAPVSIHKTTTTAAGSKVNLNGPTKEDKAESEQHKTNVNKDGEAQPTKTTTADGRLSVTPTIAYADKNTVNAYVQGVFEDDGICTATLTQGSQKITRTSTGFKNASYTQCTPISLSDAGVSTGTWNLVVSYSSSTAQGSSSQATL